MNTLDHYHGFKSIVCKRNKITTTATTTIIDNYTTWMEQIKQHTKRKSKTKLKIERKKCLNYNNNNKCRRNSEWRVYCAIDFCIIKNW